MSHTTHCGAIQYNIEHNENISMENVLIRERKLLGNEGPWARTGYFVTVDERMMQVVKEVCWEVLWSMKREI